MVPERTAHLLLIVLVYYFALSRAVRGAIRRVPGEIIEGAGAGLFATGALLHHLRLWIPVSLVGLGFVLVIVGEIVQSRSMSTRHRMFAERMDAQNQRGGRDE